MNSEFNKEGSVSRKITLKEWGQILDFPESKTQQMMERKLRLLKDSETQGKIFYSALYSLSEWECPEEVDQLVGDRSVTGSKDYNVVMVKEVNVDEEGEAMIENVALGF